jgi:mono/diheme cytochrome c family protein
MKGLAAVSFSILIWAACHWPAPSPPPDPGTELIEKGRQIFFNETFAGNGRTCGTCHPAENNLTIDPAFIATLPKDNPLFVAEFIPALKANFENPRLMREFGLILENLDGFGDLPNKFTMRGVPHTLGLRNTVASSDGPRTGWSGDGAPGDGSLRSFATGAVIQHFTKTLNRIPGVDFRLPTAEELDALEAFQLSLGRQKELVLPLQLRGTVAKRGQDLFLSPTVGKCFRCHGNAGANVPNPIGGRSGNLNFNTGVENLPDQPQDLTGERVPDDDGFGTPGDGTFNTPSLVEAADTGPFFHTNAIETIEGAVAFFNGAAFNNSPAGRAVGGIVMDGTQVVEIAAFLRVINALENIRESIALLEPVAQRKSSTEERIRRSIGQAAQETQDSIRVLSGGGLHPQAVQHLEEARRQIRKAEHGFLFRSKQAKEAIEQLEKARAELAAVS